MGRLVADPNTGSFPVVRCNACKVLPTHHPCLAVVTVGGLLFGSTGEAVCATAVCGPCNARFDNGNIVRCRHHSTKFQGAATPAPNNNVSRSRTNNNNNNKTVLSTVALFSTILLLTSIKTVVPCIVYVGLRNIDKH
jgi:hypothetical protein